ncbi:MAG TPA: molybdopterin-dependent oxidoreductase [Nitriliruptorales bacterium]
MTRTVYRTCPLCEATCGLELQLDGDRVVSVRGDAQDVFSQGYLCPKGAAYGELHDDPDRLTQPLVRRDGELVPASWDEAFEEVARRLAPILETDRNAVGIYLGNPTVHSLSGSFYVRPLIKALATRNVFSASTVDQMPKHVQCGLMFGDPLAIPVPDLDRTDHLVILGANPLMSNGSLATAPDWPGRLKAIRARGGKVVVVDPRYTRTAARADEHVAIRPGADGYLLAAMLHTLFDEELADLAELAGHVAGEDAVLEAVKAFPPERVTDACGITAATIRRMARELAAAERAVVYGRIGTQTVEFGTLTSWLVDLLNAFTGNLDRPGGAMFAYPAHSQPKPARQFRTGRWTSRVRGLPEALSELPSATIADEILTEGEGRIRAMVTVAGNPARSTPNTARFEAALASLDLLVCVDPYLNETTRYADVVLPPEPHLMRAHYDAAFYNLAVRNVANFSPPELDLPDDTVPEWHTLLRLAGIATGLPADAPIEDLDRFVASTVAQQLATTKDSGGHGHDAEELLAAVAPRVGPERILDLLLRAGPYGDGFGAASDGLTLARLEGAPHGIDLGPLEPRIPANLRTPSGVVELAPDPLLADVDRLDAALDDVTDGFVLIGRRHVRTNNSWMHNLPNLNKGRDLCTLQVHPEDAAELGLTEGGRATVTSAAGCVVAPVELTEGIRRRVVSLPHGFGHDVDETRLSVARQQPGVDSNRLTDETRTDPLSGNAVLNAIPVTVGPA